LVPDRHSFFWLKKFKKKYTYQIIPRTYTKKLKRKGKAIPVKGRGGP
jgi:hypothetical protein